MKVAQYQQPDVLTDALASARIPHNRPVRARIPNVQLFCLGDSRLSQPFFCNIGSLELLEERPSGDPCPDLDDLDVELSGHTRQLKHYDGWVDLIARILVNGKVDVHIEQVVPC